MILPFIKASTATVYNFYYKKMDYTGAGENKLILSRNQTMLMLHNNQVFYIHQGRTWVRARGTKFHVGYKAGSITATKKPFFFRSKKKRGVK